MKKSLAFIVKIKMILVETNNSDIVRSVPVGTTQYKLS